MEIKYTLYRNEMPATRDSAPYLARVVPNGVVNKLQLTDDVVATEFLTATTCDSATAAIRTKAIELILDGWTVEFGGVNFRANITGSFDTEDGSWDLDRNNIEIIAEPTDALRNVLADVTPTLAHGDLASLVKLSTEMDLTSKTFSTVVGSNLFRIAGNLLTMDGEDEYVKALPADGTEPIAATVLRVEDGQRAECRFEPALAPGRYHLEIATHGLIAEPSLRIFRLPVTVKAATVPPAPTSVVNEITSLSAMVDQVYEGAETHICGLNLFSRPGDRLTAKQMRDGEIVRTGEVDSVKIHEPVVGPGQTLTFYMSEILPDLSNDDVGDTVEFTLVTHGGVEGSAPQTIVHTCNVVENPL